MAACRKAVPVSAEPPISSVSLRSRHSLLAAPSRGFILAGGGFCVAAEGMGHNFGQGSREPIEKAQNTERNPRILLSFVWSEAARIAKNRA